MAASESAPNSASLTTTSVTSSIHLTPSKSPEHASPPSGVRGKRFVGELLGHPRNCGLSVYGSHHASVHQSDSSPVCDGSSSRQMSRPIPPSRFEWMSHHEHRIGFKGVSLPKLGRLHLVRQQGVPRRSRNAWNGRTRCDNILPLCQHWVRL